MGAGYPVRLLRRFLCSSSHVVMPSLAAWERLDMTEARGRREAMMLPQLHAGADWRVLRDGLEPSASVCEC